MDSLKKIYTARRINEIVEKSSTVSEMKSRIDTRMKVLNETVTLINEEKIDKEEAKKIAKAVAKLETIIDKFGGENGQLPNISKMVSSVVSELNKFQGAGWWTRLMGTLKSSSNPLARAAAIETLISSGMDLVGTLIDQQGKRLTDDPIVDQEEVGQNIVASLKKAFDPGHTSTLSNLAGGKLAQLLGLKGSIGDMFASDLANLKPSQLRALAQEMKSVPPITPDSVADAMNAPVTSSPSEKTSQTSASEPTTSRDTTSDGPIQTHDISDDPEHVISTQLSKMSDAIKARDSRTALYWAAAAMQKLGLSTDDALNMFKIKK